MIDYLDDIESDLSRFHRIDDPMKLDSPRYFKLVDRLVYYEGAITAIARAEVEREAPVTASEPSVQHTPRPQQRQRVGSQARRVDDVRQLAALTKSPGGGFQFPELEIAGG